jgi:hypothetical protein
MRQAELHNSTGVLDDFDKQRTVACYVPKDADGSYPEQGQYVLVWQVFPNPDKDYEGIGPLGYGIIDAVLDKEQSTNCVVYPLKEMDSIHPYYPGQPNKPKLCPGVVGVISRCDKPITRLTAIYTNMVCDRCYPHAQKRDEEYLDIEKEMMENHRNPARQYQD